MNVLGKIGIFEPRHGLSPRGFGQDPNTPRQCYNEIFLIIALKWAIYNKNDKKYTKVLKQRDFDVNIFVGGTSHAQTRVTRFEGGGALASGNSSDPPGEWVHWRWAHTRQTSKSDIQCEEFLKLERERRVARVATLRSKFVPRSNDGRDSVGEGIVAAHSWLPSKSGV